MSSQNRKQRRLYEKYLKQASPVQYKEWKKESIKRGEEYHKQHVESTINGLESQLENLQTRMIQNMKSQGLSDSEINEYNEDWLSSTKMWSENQKVERFVDLRRKRKES